MASMTETRPTVILTTTDVMTPRMISLRKLRQLRLIRRVGDGIGCVWLVLIPLAVFLLCQIYQMRLLIPPAENPAWFYLDANVTDVPGMLTNFSSLTSVDQAGSDITPQARLHHLERQVTDEYMRVQLALLASSGSLRPLASPLMDVGTLNDLRTFQPLLTPREKAALLYLFELFAAACLRHGLRFFLMDSSLVGSLRHHGVIPWSDVSIRVAMDGAEQDKVRAVVGGLEGVMLMWPNPYKWSLRLTDSRPEPPDLLHSTYLSIQFYHLNASHLWMDTWGHKSLLVTDRDRVFPLTLRPFEGRLVPVPCDVSSVLKPGAVQQCRAVLEDDREMEFRDAGPVECRLLALVFPFVTRRLPVTSDSSLEQLFVNHTLMYSISVDVGCWDSAFS